MKHMRTSHALLCALLLSAPPAAVQAQESSAVVEGRILAEGSDRAVPGVLVRFESGPEALADAEGRFRVDGLDAGVHRVTLVTPDCGVSHGEVEVAAGALHRAELYVPDVPDVLAARAPASGGERTEDPHALVLTAAEIGEMRAPDVTEVVRRVAPAMVGNSGGRVGATDRLQGRTINSLGDRQPPVVVVDGVRVADGATTLDLLDPSDVERLEVLRGASGGWAYGSSGSAGAILVTIRGAVRDTPRLTVPGREPADPRRCPAPDGSPGA